MSQPYGIYKNPNKKGPTYLVLAFNDTVENIYGKPLFTGTKEECIKQRKKPSKLIDHEEE